MIDQELDGQKARAWDKLYEWAIGRTLVHVNVDLDDVEKRMDELLAQESAEHKDIPCTCPAHMPHWTPVHSRTGTEYRQCDCPRGAGSHKEK